MLALSALTEGESRVDRTRFERWAMELGEGFISLIQWDEYEEEREKTDTFIPRVLLAAAQVNAWVAGEIGTSELLLPFEEAQAKFRLDWGDAGITE